MFRKEDLINEIREAFKNVKLEDGVGLWEAQGIDDYADNETIAELSKKDEREDWDKISCKDLDYCYSSLCFFDAKGMLFHLPKFLIFEISDGLTSHDLIFTLELNDEKYKEYQNDRFSLLNKKQILCIIHFLEYKLEMVNLNDTSCAEISRNLNSWKEKLQQK